MHSNFILLETWRNETKRTSFYIFFYLFSYTEQLPAVCLFVPYFLISLIQLSRKLTLLKKTFQKNFALHFLLIFVSLRRLTSATWYKNRVTQLQFTFVWNICSIFRKALPRKAFVIPPISFGNHLLQYSFRWVGAKIPPIQLPLIFSAERSRRATWKIQINSFVRSNRHQARIYDEFPPRTPITPTLVSLFAVCTRLCRAFSFDLSLFNPWNPILTRLRPVTRYVYICVCVCVFYNM